MRLIACLLLLVILVGSHVIVFPSVEDEFHGKKIEKTTSKGSRSVDACKKYQDDMPAPINYNILEGTIASRGQFPHMATLGYKDSQGNMKFFCGGSLISNRFILTAAQCLVSYVNSSYISDQGRLIVRLGQNELGSNETYTDIEVQEKDVILHPEFLKRFAYHDIALISLSKVVEFTKYIRPACLNTNPNDISKEIPLTATGWGIINTETGQMGEMWNVVLKKVNLNTMQLNSCNETLRNLSYPNYDRKIPYGLNGGHMCTFNPYSKESTCNGDSGGPLQTIDGFGLSMIYGIIAFGYGCGGNTPEVYTRVAHYIEWIEDYVWPI